MDQQTFAELVGALEDEQHVLRSYLARLSETEWAMETTAAGWTVRDVVSHLIVCDRMTLLTATSDRPFDTTVERAERDNPVPLAGDDALTTVRPERLLAELESSGAESARALREAGAHRRLNWGSRSMASASLVTARVMEYWAHGIDCRGIRSDSPSVSDRVRLICRLGYVTLPGALARAGVSDADLTNLQLRLLAPTGAIWTFGPTEAADLITGPALDWARVAVRRADPATTRLEAHGPVALQALTHARAYP